MNKNISSTINFYNKNALEYFNTTVNGNMFVAYERFLKYLNPNDYILDLGCGSGRDSKFFLDKGFKVDSIDGSSKMCDLASSYTGQEVERMNFLDLDKDKEYNAIWACASILHIPLDDIPTMITKMNKALKRNGYMYISLKDGSEEEIIDGKIYTYFTIDGFKSLLDVFNELEVTETWSNKADKEKHLWNNFIIRKM